MVEIPDKNDSCENCIWYKDDWCLYKEHFVSEDNFCRIWVSIDEYKEIDEPN